MLHGRPTLKLAMLQRKWEGGGLAQNGGSEGGGIVEEKVTCLFTQCVM